MNISKLGEFGLIERFKRSIKLDASVIRGTGDDCAVISFNREKYLLFTCDMLVEGVDFLKNTDPYLVGRKAVAVSLSDIAACAGLPRYCLVSLGLPRGTRVSFTDRLFKGMRDIALKYGVNIVGGDLSRCSKLTIDVSMIGFVERENLVLRSNAAKGDIIFTSGALGGSLKGKHLKFTPRLKQARFLVKKFRPSSMTDISDGLIQDLGHILKASSAGAVIYQDLIPLSRDARNINNALYDGEDFELLFSVPFKKAKALMKKNSRAYHAIGEIVDKQHGLVFINDKGKAGRIRAGGFRHF